MKRLALTIGGGAVLALGVFSLSDRAPDSVRAPESERVPSSEAVERPAEHPPVMQSDIGLMPIPATRSLRIPTTTTQAPAPQATPGERLAQQLGTACQTPQGSICTVAPQPINTSCDCGGVAGLIVR